MKYAPPSPTTAELARLHPLSDADRRFVQASRQQIIAGLGNVGRALVGIVGPCALNDHNEGHILDQEDERLRNLAAKHPGLIVAARRNGWKPRSNPADWHGLETTNPQEAYRIANNTVRNRVAVAMEVGYPDHLARYVDRASFIWRGARGDADEELLRAMALADPNLPIGIKNSEDGRVTSALKAIKRVEAYRQGEGAPAFLIYRGGKELQNPDAWEEGYMRAWDATGGNMIVDFAHGAERAHDPNGKFDRTVAGHLAALDHGIELALEGYPSSGALIESSDTTALIDPHVPHSKGLSALELHYEASVSVDPLPLVGVH